MDTIEILFCAIFLSIIYLYYRFKNNYTYFERNGIPYIKPVLFFGNVADWVFMKKPLPVVHFELYKKLEPHSFAGVYLGGKKTFLIRDAELVKNILVKDFACFRDRGIKRDPHDILSRNLFMMRGDDWKNLRIKLTSTFTSGKMKMMFPLVDECGSRLHEKMQKITDTDILIKDVCSRFTTDVIGSCAFGLEINSLDDPDSEFRKIGNRILDSSFTPVFRSIMRNMLPAVAKLSKHLHTDTTVQDFFVDLVQKTVKYREDNKIKRGDFLDLLINLKNDTSSQKSNDQQVQEDLTKFLDQLGENHVKSNIAMTFELMTAQCFVFFIAGFETSSSTLSYMLLELSQHQDIQQKVRQEIITVLQKHDNQLSYDMLKELKYLDLVIAETLRKYPITGNLVRECTQTYKIPDSKTIIEQGTPVVISILGIHHNEKYYEKPNDFYPEHFTEQAKSKRPNYAYLPFGEGPRICIGERFAKMQIKVGVVNLLKDFSYHLSPKTKLPTQFTAGATINDVKGGIWLQCRKL
uniref:Cytochrome P450 6PZ15 n=1 Tax=Maconellicoccus hirsutus TaxID=177089 RepID=A0AAT9UTF6_MACHI